MAGTYHANLVNSHAISHFFDLIIDKGPYDLGSWSKLSGLAIKWDKAEVKQGGSDAYFKYAGQPKYDNLKFARAVEKQNVEKVQNWLKDVHMKGGNEEIGGAVRMLSSDGSPVYEIPLRNIFPVEWSIQDFDSNSGKVAIETLTIAHDGIYMEGTGRSARSGGAGLGG